MDPTAPKDNSLANDPQNPIQPGQFVVAGEDNSLSPKPKAPAPISKPQFKTPPPSPPIPNPTNIPQGPPPSITTPPVVPPPSPKIEAMPKMTPVPPVPPASPPPPSPAPQTPSVSAEPAASQPDPTPFVPPSVPDQQAMGTPTQGPSGIGRLRIIAIVLAVLVLVALIAGVFWFFVLGKRGQEPVKTQSAPEEQVEEPSSPPKRTNGGFGDLPQATSEATPAATPTPPEEGLPLIPITQ